QTGPSRFADDLISGPRANPLPAEEGFAAKASGLWANVRPKLEKAGRATALAVAKAWDVSVSVARKGWAVVGPRVSSVWARFTQTMVGDKVQSVSTGLWGRLDRVRGKLRMLWIDAQLWAMKNRTVSKVARRWGEIEAQV